jgi:hypothetical protein
MLGTRLKSVQNHVATKVRCRAITEDDLDQVAALLAKGFAGRSKGYWTQGLQRLRHRPVPDGLQRFGFALEADGHIAGTLLLIASTRMIEGRPASFANVAAWYVEPAYRGSAQLLVSVGLRNRDVTYLNVTPAPHTWPIVESQGYTQYCAGLYFALAPLTTPARNTVIERLDAEGAETLPEYPMLREHANYGCTALVCRDDEGRYPFLFRPFRIRSGRVWSPAILAIYARSQAELVRFTGTIGRHFMKHGMPDIALDADGPIAGLSGHFTALRGRKYYKGPNPPRLCDLTGTELAIFGL